MKTTPHEASYSDPHSLSDSTFFEPTVVFVVKLLEQEDMFLVSDGLKIQFTSRWR
jgi:hypothetical protein